MPVTVKTFASTSEAAAALSSDRGARYLGGGTLVMRALNEGDISIETVVRATDRALNRIDASSARARIEARLSAIATRLPAPAERPITLRDLLTLRFGFGVVMAPPDSTPTQVRPFSPNPPKSAMRTTSAPGAGNHPAVGDVDVQHAPG